ncbi:MucR family transcriptional regulator [Methylobacterium sp. J-068]|uniref:MucR family transcriptional regulator n=1 Tax=Methylobacterium sp. J-068 TaxID=2836649 RepID=UPI001FB8894C|nr:MucR family transcriptional regulator [Methylobacterium sp. J-068]MCJ2032753.1 MucR family transcriptional regulator [Methylobacterium sp. J-068]
MTLTVDIVTAFVSNNSIPVSELANLLTSVHTAVSGLISSESSGPAKDAIAKAAPAQVKKSITPEALISFEDGKPYKTLKRHLTLRGLSPEAYRAKHGLPADYPMTCANYSAQRSELARGLGLGQQRRSYAKAAGAEETVSKGPGDPKKAGRPRKVSAA